MPRLMFASEPDSKVCAVQGRPIYIQHLGQVNIKKIYEITTEERMLKFHVQEYERCIQYIMPACSKVAGRHIEQTFAILDVKGMQQHQPQWSSGLPDICHPCLECSLASCHSQRCLLLLGTLLWGLYCNIMSLTHMYRLLCATIPCIFQVSYATGLLQHFYLGLHP